MKTFINPFLIACCLFAQMALAQAPQSFKYQAIARNNADALIANQQIKVQVSIRDLTPSGTIVYQEQHTITTNALGLFTISVGGGTVVGSNSFSNIKWGDGNKFIEISADLTGGNTLTSLGVSQLLSVPYALYSLEANHSKSTNQIGGFERYLGEKFMDGIIFYLFRGSDGKEHGLVVSITELSGKRWGRDDFFEEATNKLDGEPNTAKIPNTSAYPLKSYVESLGSGWYIPAIEELRLLWLNKFIVNKSLNNFGHQEISDTIYWSSTEGGMSGAFWVNFDFNGINTSGGGKMTNGNFRAIKKF